MKKLPKSITIFGRKIPIKCVPSSKIIELYPDFSQAPQGLWDSGNRVIYINSDYPLKDQHYTLCHELGHAAFTCVGIDLVIDPVFQEVIVQTVATLIEDVLNQHKILK